MDDLRERVAELAGINLTDFLEEGKGTGTGGQTQGGKGKAKVGRENFDTFKSVSGELRPTAAAHVRRTRYSLDLVKCMHLHPSSRQRVLPAESKQSGWTHSRIR